MLTPLSKLFQGQTSASSPPFTIKFPIELVIPQILPSVLECPSCLWSGACYVLAADVASDFKSSSVKEIFQDICTSPFF